MAHVDPPHDSLSPNVLSDDAPGQQASTESAQSGPATSRAPSFSSVRSNKSKHAEAGITEVHADQASLSMPPPPPPRSIRNLGALSHSTRSSDNAETGADDAVSIRSVASTSQDNDGTEDSITPRLVPGAFSDKPDEHTLPDPAMPSSRSSFSDDTKRMSISSIYSLASARGIPSSAASANGSDTGSAGPPRSVSGFMASSAPKQGDTGISNVTVTTQGSAGGNLAPREHHHHLPDIAKRTASQIPRSDPSGPAARSQPSRDRSRAKRRLSGSTAASSHSPSSDRTLQHKEKEEGSLAIHSNKITKSLTVSVAKPAPLGIIGVCALDVKARSKPSRNILNRLIANREFDVKIFGDKVILDEGMSLNL